MSLVAGTRLGPYEIQSAIGAGGMGEVYKARDTRLDRTVAIKILPTELSSDDERRTRFAREAKTIASLNHPHICTLYDVGEHDGATFLVMELLDGEPLRARLGEAAVHQAVESERGDDGAHCCVEGRTGGCGGNERLQRAGEARGSERGGAAGLDEGKHDVLLEDGAPAQLSRNVPLA